MSNETIMDPREILVVLNRLRPGSKLRLTFRRDLPANTPWRNALAGLLNACEPPDNFATIEQDARVALKGVADGGSWEGRVHRFEFTMVTSYDQYNAPLDNLVRENLVACAEKI